MEIQKYLKRINHTADIEPTLTALKALHKNHLYNIPFENLDIHNNKRIILDENYLFDKIFHQNRGGYCYELNGMFYLLLKKLRYKVKMISARVSNGKGGWGEEFDHMAIIVEFDDLWLADVGFGESFIEPIKIELDRVQKSINGFYKIVKHDGDYYKLMKSSNGNEFTEEFLFTLNERSWNEFKDMNTYHQTSPLSHFTQRKVCSIATENGRITLSNDKLTITQDKNKQVKDINDEEFEKMLFEYFGIIVKVKS